VVSKRLDRLLWHSGIWSAIRVTHIVLVIETECTLLDFKLESVVFTGLMVVICIVDITVLVSIVYDINKAFLIRDDLCPSDILHFLQADPLLPLLCFFLSRLLECTRFVVYI